MLASTTSLAGKRFLTQRRHTQARDSLAPCFRFRCGTPQAGHCNATPRRFTFLLPLLSFNAHEGSNPEELAEGRLFKSTQEHNLND